MIGIGPIKMKSINYHNEKVKKIYEAKVMSAKEFLGFFLKFEEDELKEMNIVETKLSSGNDEIMYIALEDREHVRDIHRRKAQCKNDDILVRNFIPPQIYQRYMSLNKLCSDRRKEDTELRTQIRFGKIDLEVLTKEKGTQDPFKNIDLKQFLGDDTLPMFDHNIKWTYRPDRQPRRRATSSPCRGFLPSLGQGINIQPSRTKQIISKTTTNEPEKVKSKKVEKVLNKKMNEENMDESEVSSTEEDEVADREDGNEMEESL